MADPESNKKVTKELKSQSGGFAILTGGFRSSIRRVNDALLNGNINDIAQVLPTENDWQLAYVSVMGIFTEEGDWNKKVVQFNSWMLTHSITSGSLMTIIANYADNNPASIFYSASILFLVTDIDATYSRLTVLSSFSNQNCMARKALELAKNSITSAKQEVDPGLRANILAEYETLLQKMVAGTETDIQSEDDLLRKLNELESVNNMSEAMARANQIISSVIANPKQLSFVVGYLNEVLSNNIASYLIPAITSALYVYMVKSHQQLDEQSLASLTSSLIHIANHPIVYIYLIRNYPQHASHIVMLRVLSGLDLENLTDDQIVEWMDKLSRIEVEEIQRQDVDDAITQLWSNLALIQKYWQQSK